jgi:amino acid transporter
LKKTLEIVFYVSFSAGMAFGTSCFMMLAGIFEIETAQWVLGSIFIAGLFSILISASIAELASMYPSSPGIRTYLKVAFANRTSLTLVYLYLIFMVLIAGVESYMFALVARAVFPNLPTMGFVLGLLAFTIIVNLLGFELPRGLQIVTTALLLFAVVILGVYGILHAPNAENASSLVTTNSLPQFALFPAATVMAVFLFTGFEWVTLLGFSPQAYQHRIPLSMPLAIILLLLVYSTFAYGLSVQLPRAAIVASPVPQVPYFTKLLGASGPLVAWAVSILAIFSTFNAGIMGGGKLIYVLTRERNLPKWCGKMSLRTGAPIGGIILLGSLAGASSFIVLTFKIELLAAVVASAIVSFVYASFLLAVIVLQKKQSQAHRPFRTPVPRWLQWFVILLLPVMGLMSLFSQVNLHYQPVATLIALIILASGLTEWSIRRSAH